MNGIKAKFNNQTAYVTIKNTNLCIKGSTDYKVPLSSIKSLHVKNEDPIYHLKIKLSNDDVFLSFLSINTRDMVKNLILHHIKPDKEVMKTVLSQDKTTKSMYENTKSIIDTSTFLNIRKDRLKDLQAALQQASASEITTDPEKFVYSLPTQILEIFSEMGCSINQLYNYITTSYFADVRNKPNTFDRLLSEKIRNYKTESDGCNRINTYSVLALSNIDAVPSEARSIEDKPVDFQPMYYFHKVEANRPIRDYCPVNKELYCSVEAIPEEKPNSVAFDERDLVRLRDLKKIVYLSKKK